MSLCPNATECKMEAEALEEIREKLRESTDYAEARLKLLRALYQESFARDLMPTDIEEMATAHGVKPEEIEPQRESEISTINGGLHSRHSTHASAAHGESASAGASVVPAQSAGHLSGGGSTALPASADPHPNAVLAVGTKQPVDQLRACLTQFVEGLLNEYKDSPNALSALGRMARYIKFISAIEIYPESSQVRSQPIDEADRSALLVRHSRGCFNDESGATLCCCCGGDLEPTR